MKYEGTRLRDDIVITEIVTVHYYEFAKDYVFSGEQHNWWELVYVDKGELKAEDAATFPHKNIITRALGVDNHVEIDFYSFSFDSECLLLCSDGLYNFVNSEEIIGLLNNPDIGFENMAAELIKAANNNGGGDNITAVLVKR